MSRNQLTHRENEVLQLVIHGLTNDEIAGRLAISRRTVETHMRAVFHKTGVTRRAQLMARIQQGDGIGAEPTRIRDDPADPTREQEPDVTGRDRRLRLYAAALRRLVDRQFPLFDERVEITVTIGEQDGHDGVVERRWTTPKPYLVYRILRPIVAWTGPPPDPDELALACDVHGQDIHADVSPMRDADGQPLVMILFQPGLRAPTEWTLRYRSPRLWSPLRSSGRDTLTWATADLDQRHRPTIDQLTLKVVFPVGWADEQLIEKDNLGVAETVRLPTGQIQATWRDRTPIAAAYHWELHGRHAAQS